MTAEDITPAELLTTFAVFVLVTVAVWAVFAWRAGRRKRSDDPARDDPVIDLAYLERAIKADEDAAARRAADKRPLLSQAPDAQPDREHRLPRGER